MCLRDIQPFSLVWPPGKALSSEAPYLVEFHQAPPVGTKIKLKMDLGPIQCQVVPAWIAMCKCERRRLKQSLGLILAARPIASPENKMINPSSLNQTFTGQGPLQPR